MPTLSPHPPAVAPSPMDKAAATPSEPPKSIGSLNSPAPQRGEDFGKASSEAGGTKCEASSNGSGGNVSAPTLKRPLLSSREYERELVEEEQNLELLYDYTTLDAW